MNAGRIAFVFTLMVVVPTYNEADGIDVALDRIRSAVPYADVLVVDDASPDGTAALVAARPDFGSVVTVLNRAAKDGLGSAYRAGFERALATGHDAVVQLDADLSHPPERIPALIAALGHADVVIGSRYVAGGASRNWSVGRRFISWAANQYVRLVLNVHIRDATAGFRAYRASALRAIAVQDSESNGYAFQIENTWRAHRAGLRIVELPIVFTDRASGRSKMSVSIAVEALAAVGRWRWQELRAGVARRGNHVDARR